MVLWLVLTATDMTLELFNKAELIREHNLRLSEARCVAIFVKHNVAENRVTRAHGYCYVKEH